MEVPQPLTITASLMAGYEFLDGSLLEVDANGDYRITDAAGEVIAETVDTTPGEGNGLRFGVPPEDYGEIFASLASFLKHDAEIFEFSPQGSWGKRYPDSADEIDEEELIFDLEVARWADEHDYELCEVTAELEEEEA